MKNWYVLFVFGGKEKVLTDFLNQHYASLKAFIPMMEVMHRKQGKSELVKKVMFPSYVFIKTDLNHDDFNQLLKNIRLRKEGIIKELKYDDEGTSSLYPGEIEILNALLDKENVLKHSTGFIEQESIVITEGPLAGHESQIKKIDRHKRRALIELEILGEVREVSVSLEIIKKI